MEQEHDKQQHEVIPLLDTSSTSNYSSCNAKQVIYEKGDEPHHSEVSAYVRAATITIVVCGLLLVTLVVVFLMALVTGSGLHHKPNPPHILVVMVDDMGHNDVGFNNAEYQTANIDQLARSGIIFKNHYVSHVCTPSRSAFFTGRQPLEHGTSIPYVPMTTGGLPTDVFTLSEGMKRLGYGTHMVGKWHLGYSSFDQTPLGRGFDTFFGMFGGMVEYFTHDFADIPEDSQIQCEDSKALPTGAVWGKDLYDGVTPVGDQFEGQYVTTIFTERVVDIINDHAERADHDPLFLYVSYTAPHDPWQAPFKYIDSPQCASVTSANRKIYCGMMQVLDEGIGNITSALQDVGYLENTLILFLSDNGAAVNDAGLFSNEVEPAGSNYPLRGAKNTLFEGGPKAPAFVWGNPVRPNTVVDGVISPENGKTTDALFHISDWYLTLLNAALAESWEDVPEPPSTSSVATKASSATSTSRTNVRASKGKVREILERASQNTGVVSKESMKEALDVREIPQIVFTSPTSDGTTLESSYNQWQNLRYGGTNPRKTVIYHFQYPTDPEYAAIRNKDYKLFVGTDMPIVDGWFDTSNKSRELIRCTSPSECQSKNPGQMFWKISTDPEERQPLDTSKLDEQEQGHFDELRQELSKWKSVVVPVPDQTLDAQGLPRYWDCNWHPWIGTETWPLDVETSCVKNIGEMCGPVPKVKDWEQYAGTDLGGDEFTKQVQS